MSLRICHITSMHGYDDDRIFERACVGLARLGHDVHLVATHEGQAELEGVKIHGLKDRSGASRRIWSSREASLKAKELEADIYHFHDPDLIPWMIKLARKNKVVYDIHENYVDRIERMPALGPMAGPTATWFRKYELHAVKQCSGYVAATEGIRDLFQQTGKPGIVVRNVPDLVALQGIELNGVKFDHPTIYTSGTHSDARNCRETLISLPGVLKEFPGAQMVFVGRYHPASYLEDLKGLALELGIQEQVQFEGMIPWKTNFERTSRAHFRQIDYG